jgi:hypothetical protein
VVDDDEDMDTAVFLACAGTRSETLLAAALLLVDVADRATILAAPGFSKAIVAMVPMAGRQGECLREQRWRWHLLAADVRCGCAVRSAVAS